MEQAREMNVLIINQNKNLQPGEEHDDLLTEINHGVCHGVVVDDFVTDLVTNGLNFIHSN